MTTEEQKKISKKIPFDPKASISRAVKTRSEVPEYVINTSRGRVSWKNKPERVAAIRKGLPYESVEVIGKKANMPIKQVLHYLGIAQTTYHKKKRENNLLSGRNSEVLLILSEVLDFGLEVFNYEEEKFYRWLKKPNLSLGNEIPQSLFDSVTGIQEVRNALSRLEYGNMA